MQQDPTISHQPAPPAPTYQVSPPPLKPQRRKEGWRSILSTILILAAAPIIALVLTAFVFQSYEVDGPSMETTLQNHDRLIVNKIPRTLAKLGTSPYIPKRGDIIIFHRTGDNVVTSAEAPSTDKQLIKRVIALPGERIVVSDNRVTVYNRDNPDGFNPDSEGGYGSADRITPGNVDLTVPNNQVFVMGDNRTNSLDSRSFGPVASDEIVGKLFMRFFPFTKVETY